MGIVSLSILDPQHESQFVGATASSVRLRGSVSSGHGTLFYRWYSSLGGALSDSLTNALDIIRPLAVGSHVLTLSAKDVQGDAMADLKAVKEAGMTGGPPVRGVEAPCVVHVFVARMRKPDPSTATLSKAGSILVAVAPTQWGRETTPGSRVYEPNPEYHSVNRIRYRWRFEPQGPPAGRASDELVPKLTQLMFGPDVDTNAPPVVTYRGPLPSGLGSGNYTLTLRVEDKDDPAVGDSTSLAVVLTV